MKRTLGNMNVDDDAIPTPPPPPPPAPPPRRLTRSTDDKVLTGLCGGLGRALGVDPVVFRIAFVVLAFVGGTGVLLYLAGWLLVPDDRGVIEADRLLGERSHNVVLAVLVLLGLLLVLDRPDHRWDGDFPFALVLIGLGAAVLWSRQNRARSGPEAGSTVPADAPAAVDAPPTVGPPVPPPPPRPRSMLVPATLSLLLILAGVLALLGVSLVTGLAVALLVTGAALVVGARRGRARGLIPVALVLTGALATASFADVPFEGGVGERTYRPLTVAELRSPYRISVGELVVDLSGLDLSGQQAEVVVTAGIGDVQVIVPRSVQLVVIGHASLGEVEIFGSSWEGSAIDRRFVAPGGREGGGRLTVRARVGIGELEVRRGAA